MSTPEVSFFNSGGIVITNTRAKFSGKTYALANITSVSAEQFNPYTGYGVILLILGVIATISGIQGIQVSSTALVIFISGLVGLILGIWLCVLKYYKVVLTSAAQEVDALQSRDKDLILDIVDAINEAIIHRG